MKNNYLIYLVALFSFTVTAQISGTITDNDGNPLSFNLQ